ncbi:MAG: PKD repeat protein [Flavobacteriaceae bacterium]|jgi:PKD repeat protein
MKNLILAILAGLFPILSFAQAQSCGTEIDETNLVRLTEYNQRWQDRLIESKAYGTTTFYVPVQIHILRNDAGAGGISEADCLRAFDRLNDYYINASVHFYQVESINYVDDDNYFDYDKSQMNDLDADHGVTDVMNIYIANTVYSSGSAICGHAQFPGGLDFVMQSTSCMKNGSTLAHEVGHYMGLYHTHETSFGDESADGSDCAVDGDLLCDTPADPRLNGSTNFSGAGCNYYGTDTDENGDQYDPAVSNALSYASKECRVDFSEDQTERILWTLENERAYLDWPQVLINVDALFYLEPINDCNNVTAVRFYNASEGGDTYAWDFGDGVGTSSAESPSYPYGLPGNYDVTLVVTDILGFTSTYTKNIAVGAVSLPYFNDFDNGDNDLQDFTIVNSMKTQVTSDAAAAETGAYGMLFDGTEFSSSSPTFQTPTSATAFSDLWNPYYKSTASICVNGIGYTDLSLDFDKRQLRTSNDNYTYIRVLVNDVQINSVIGVETSNSDDGGFTNYSFDLSAYDGTVFNLTIEGSHKYNINFGSTNSGSATMIDNFTIDGVEDPSQVGLTELGASMIRTYPNPTNGQLMIQSVNVITDQPEVLSLNGQVLSSQVNLVRTSTNAFKCDLSSLADGIYLINVGDEVVRVVRK